MKLFFTLLLSICLLFSTGCSAAVGMFDNYRPIEQLKLVHTLGFDLHEEGLELSICGGEKEGQGITRLSAAGENISQCLERLQHYSGSSELYYAHTRYVLVGEDYARQGLGDILQYLESSNQLRSDIPLFIVKDGTAKSLVLRSGGEDKGIHDEMEAVLRSCAQQGIGFPFSCGDIGSFCAEYGSALACALTVSPTKSADPAAEDDQTTPVAAGYGVLDLGTLVGFLSAEISPAVGLLMGELPTDPITVTLQNKPVSIRITKAETALRPTFGQQGTMTELTVELQAEATLEESRQGQRPDTKTLSEDFSRMVQQWTEELLMTLRSSGCDFLGFGPRIAIAYPKEMTASPLPWVQQLQGLSVTAHVTCRVRHGENESESGETEYA